jgi:hypothetical protein
MPRNKSGMKRQIIFSLDSDGEPERIAFIDKLIQKHASKNGWRGATVNAIRELIDIARNQGKE